LLERGRESFEKAAWRATHEQLSAADADTSLDAGDLEHLGLAAYLLGMEARGDELLSRAHQEHLNHDDGERAALCAFWLGMHMANRGDVARAAGWFARSRRLLEQGALDSVVAGYLLVPDAMRALRGGDPRVALPLFEQAAAIGDRFRDPDLMVLGRLGQGQSTINLGRTAPGIALLDEVMVSVTAGEVSPIPAGIAYCAVIDACQRVFDVGRAQEWTSALTQWCESQPDLVPFSGQCLVHRAQLLRLHGAWPDALEAARSACQRFARDAHGGAGAAFFELGEVHRLAGDFAAAEDAYRQASQWGHEPQPGLAQLRLAQGRVEAASATINRVLGEIAHPAGRAQLLVASVEIELAAGDVPAARLAADELAAMAETGGVPFLDAVGHLAGAGRALRSSQDPNAGGAGLPWPGRRGVGPDGARCGGMGLPAARRGTRPGPDAGARTPRRAANAGRSDRA